MTQYKYINIKLSNSQHYHLKSTTTNGTKVPLQLSSNMIYISNDETNFLHKLLLTYRQVTLLCNAFVNNLSLNTKLSKTQISK